MLLQPAARRCFERWAGSQLSSTAAVNQLQALTAASFLSALPPQEGECFAAAAALDTHKSLVHVFFAQRSTKKVGQGG